MNRIQKHATQPSRSGLMIGLCGLMVLMTLMPAPTPIHAGPAAQSFIYLPTLLNKAMPQMPMFGVALEGYANNAGLNPVTQLGVRMARRWQPVSWEAIEPVEGQYNWQVLDALKAELQRAKTANLQSILSVQYTPVWARQTPETNCGPIRADKFEAFAEFMAQLVRQIGSATPYNARYWILGNEADVGPLEVQPNSIFGCWGNPDDAFFGGEHYGEMLKVVYSRIKAADSRATVIMSGLLMACDPYTYPLGAVASCTELRRWRSGFFFEGVLKAGAGDSFDLASVNSYAHMDLSLPSRMTSYYEWSGPAGGTGLPEKVAFLRRVLVRYGLADKPIMAGEINTKCDEPSDACTEVNAAFIPRAYAEAFNLNLATAVYYTAINENSHNGLLTPDLQPRQTYTAYQTLMRNIGQAQYVGPITATAGLAGASFRQRDGNRVQVLWSTDGTPRTMPLPAGFQCALDFLGRALTPVESQLNLDWSPVYVVTGPAGTRARRVAQICAAATLRRAP